MSISVHIDMYLHFWSCCFLTSKVSCLISLDEDIKEKSHQLGLNISRVTENSLRFILSRMEDYTTVLTKESQLPQKNSEEVQKQQ
jgi:hypothetical protein